MKSHYCCWLRSRPNRRWRLLLELEGAEGVPAGFVREDCLAIGREILLRMAQRGQLLATEASLVVLPVPMLPYGPVLI